MRARQQSEGKNVAIEQGTQEIGQTKTEITRIQVQAMVASPSAAMEMTSTAI